jgi:hypothetical protein
VTFRRALVVPSNNPARVRRVKIVFANIMARLACYEWNKVI